LINITSGAIIPLTNAALLKRVIVGYALESLDLNHVIDQLDEEQIQLVANAEPEENVLELLMGVIEEQPVAEAIENDVKHDLSDEALHNVEVYMNSPNLAAARPRLKRVCILSLTFTLKARYINQALASGYETTFICRIKAGNHPQQRTHFRGTGWYYIPRH
jgi:hypothetical protein